jgi:hypothetical protein
VRLKFASGEIPLDDENPTTLLFTLFNAVKACFPEHKGSLNKYASDGIQTSYNKYEKIVEDLLKNNEKLLAKQALINSTKASGDRLIAAGIQWFVVAGIATFWVRHWFESPIKDNIGFFFVFFFIMTLGACLYSITPDSIRRAFLRSKEMSDINSAIEEVNKGLERHKSFRLTKEKEFFLDVEKQDF